MVKFCGECGEKIISSVNFCPTCGAKLKEEDILPLSVSQASMFSSSELDLKEKKSCTSKNKNIFKMFIAAISLAAAIYMFWEDYQEAAQITAKSTTVSTEKKEEVALEKIPEIEKNKGNTVEDTPLILDDFILGDVSIGDTLQKVHQIKGKAKTEKRKDGKIYYDYADVGIVFDGGTVREIWTNDKITTTRRNIHSDLSFAEVEKVYGNKYTSQWECPIECVNGIKIH